MREVSKGGNTKGSDKAQIPYGGKNQGGVTWRNKFYTPKQVIISPFHLRWSSRWPNCDNVQCMSGTLSEIKEKCSEASNCDGFSWSKNKNKDSDRGSGCLKYNCKPDQESRKGFGFGSHGYWLKGKGGKCNESLSGYRQSGYRGCANKTKSGRKCQKWTVQFPHRHSRTPDRFKNKGLGNHNYCRNPDGEPGGIWCYTNDRRKRWEYCNPL